jgi:LPS-assembly protein
MAVRRFVPRRHPAHHANVQLVAAPRLANLTLPNEDSRTVDLEDSNLFALNRFSGYDRFEDSSRLTVGVNYALYPQEFLA